MCLTEDLSCIICKNVTQVPIPGHAVFQQTAKIIVTALKVYFWRPEVDAHSFWKWDVRTMRDVRRIDTRIAYKGFEYLRDEETAWDPRVDGRVV